MFTVVFMHRDYYAFSLFNFEFRISKMLYVTLIKEKVDAFSNQHLFSGTYF